MHSFRLLICASLFVASWMGTLAENMDYTGLCVKCVDENAFPDCPTDATAAHLNLTIYCQKFKEHYCTLGIVNRSEADVKTADYICRLQQASLDLEKLQTDEDDFKIVSIMERPVKPLPLLLQSTTESVKSTTEEGNIQILSITQEAIEPPKPEVSHMAIVANPDAMAALEDGTDAGATAEAAENGVETTAAEEPAADPETPAEHVEATPPEVDSETVPEAAEPAKEEVAEAPQPPAEVPEPPAAVPEPPAGEPEASKDEAAESASTDAETESDKNEAPAVEPEDIEVAATATEADKDEEAPSNTNSMDYQGDEAKPDSEAEAEAEAVAPPAPAVETGAGPVKVPNNPSNGNPPVLPSMKCYACTSLSYANCIARPDTEIDCRPVEEGKNIKNGCYTMFKGTQIQRGCLVDLTDAEHQNCLEASSSTCRMCETSVCNNASWPQCYTCNSSQEPLCAWWSTEAVNRVQRAICPTHSARCVIRIDAAGMTQRFCADSTVNCDASGTETCTVCAGSFCNGGVFPTDRRRCLQCVGDAACAEAQTAPLPCLLYRHDEHCFFYANATNQMIRGCASAAAEFEGCSLAASKCVQCATSDGCNDAPLMKVPQLKCRHCNSLKNPNEYEACVWAQATTLLSPCIKKFPYYLQESCLTIYNPEMMWAIRECSLDFGACEPTDQLCFSCNTDGCNGGNMMWQHCIQCDSATEPSCDSDASSIKLQRCAASVQPYEQRGCYTSFSVETNTTSRGCISDLAAEGMQYCKENVKLCSLCYEQGCNHRLVSMASFVSRMDMSMIVGMLLAVMIFSYV